MYLILTTSFCALLPQYDLYCIKLLKICTFLMLHSDKEVYIFLWHYTSVCNLTCKKLEDFSNFLQPTHKTASMLVCVCVCMCDIYYIYVCI